MEKKKLFLFCIGSFLTALGFGQEFQSTEGISIGSRERIHSLSILTPELSSGSLTLMEVNFNKEIKREVDFVAVMEEKRHEQESSYIQLESPVPTISSFEKQMIQMSNDLNMHQRGSNYDMYSGKKKIPAYEEFRADFVPLYSPYSRRRGSPYIRYSPFFR